MRIGISSRGNAWMSMGPLGWLILGPFILAWWCTPSAASVAVWQVM